MKKLAAILLAAALSMSLAACGSNSATNAAPTASAGANHTSAQQENAVDAEKEPEVAPVLERIPFEPAGANHTSAQQEKAVDAEKEPEAAPVLERIPFEPSTVIDNEICSVTVKELDPDNQWGYLVKIDLENRSSDKTYAFSGSIKVNRLSIGSMAEKTLAPGKKLTYNLYLPVQYIESVGITYMTDIQLAFYVYDADDSLGDSVAEEDFHIYPYGEEHAAKFVREPQAGDIVLAENDDISVVLVDKGYEYGPFIGDYYLNLFIDNKSDQTVLLTSSDEFINGHKVEYTSFFASVFPGESTFQTMSWYDTSIQNLNIDKIEKIEFQLNFADRASGWYPSASTLVSLEI